MYMNSELQNQGSETLNWATLKLETDRVFLYIDVVGPTVQKSSAHQSANETYEKKSKKGKEGKKGEREKPLPSQS
jgi:hypothetical protein